jgi:hypothetical protein
MKIMKMRVKRIIEKTSMEMGNNKENMLDVFSIIPLPHPHRF